MAKTVAILGGGGSGLMMAADNILRGNQVRLWEDAAYYDQNLADVARLGGIKLTGAALTGFAPAPLLTSHMAEAVKGADVILIAALSQRHQDISTQLAPLLTDAQAVCFSAGNGSSVGLYQLLAASGKLSDSGDSDSDSEDASDYTSKNALVIGEMSGNIYPCRVVAPACVLSAFAYKPKPVAAFPARNTKRLIAAFSDVYEFVPTRNILAGLLNSPNVSVHLAGSLLNANSIDRNPDFLLYTDGLSKHVIKVMLAVEEEKAAVLEALNYPVVRHLPMLEEVASYGKYSQYDLFRSLAGPSALKHRYVTEDALIGQRLLIDLAEILGVAVPTNKALEHLAGVVNSVDYFAQGITLKKLGCSATTGEGIDAYFYSGRNN